MPFCFLCFSEHGLMYRSSNLGSKINNKKKIIQSPETIDFTNLLRKYESEKIFITFKKTALGMMKKNFISFYNSIIVLTNFSFASDAKK